MSSEQDLFSQLNIKPTISKKNRNRVTENPPDLPSTEFFLEGEEGVVTLFDSSSYDGLYIDDQATVPASQSLHNVGTMMMNSGITTMGYVMDITARKPVVNVVDGVRCIEFDGVDDYLLGTVSATNFFSNSTSNCHGFAIAFKHTSGRGIFRWAHPRMNSNSRGFALRLVGTTLYLYANNWTGTTETSNTVTNFSASSWTVLVRPS